MGNDRWLFAQFFWNIDDFVAGVKFVPPSVSHFISDIFTIPIQLTIIKNVRLPAKARNHIHLQQGDMTEKMNLKEWKKQQWM